MNPALLLGAGAVLLLAAGGKKKSRGRKISCPQLTPGEGQIAGFDYIEFTTGDASLDERLPLVIFFHSLGAQPDGLAKHIADIPARARVVMPYGHEKYGSNPAWWTLRSKTEDQEGLARQMKAAAEQMDRFIEEAVACLPTVGRPVVTGHSQGGMMALAVAAESPGRVKAAVPVSGWLPVGLWPKALPPTYAVHGSNDRTVDYGRTADFITRAREANLPIELHTIEGHGHGLSGELKNTWQQIVNWAIGTEM